MKVLVCDDLPKECREFEEAIHRAKQPDIITERLFGDKLKEQFSILMKSADKILTGDGRPNDLPKTEFDDNVDVVILDNNLAHLGIQGARLTAEAIAGYIRAFSSAPYIISVNKNPDIDFDLRYLIGDYATRTDLAVNAGHLSNRALWTHKRTDAKNRFLPWYWPKLLGIGDDRRWKIKFIEGRLGKKICEAFEITSEIFDSLSRQARSSLSLAEDAENTEAAQNEHPGLKATFRGMFLASGRSLPDKDERENLLKKLDEGVTGVKTIIARVVAAEIDFWLRRDVLGPQEALVDIPHLLMRMPFLLDEDPGDVAHWNEIVDVTRDDPPFGLDPTLFDTHLKHAQFGEDDWAPFPCFWWPRLRENDELNAYFSAGDTNWADVVFCEDRSEFLPANPDTGISTPLEFVAQFEGSWNRRYVAGIDGIRYVPKTRFAQ